MDNKKKIAIAVLITFVLTTALYSLAFTVVPSIGTILGDVRARLEGGEDGDFVSKVREINRYVDEKYIYESDKEKMADTALKGYVAALGDVYTEYITKDDYKLMMETITGDYKGLGVEVFVDTDNLITVITAFEDGPAAKAGIQPFDKIIEVNSVKVNIDNYNEAVDMMKGSGDYAGTPDELLLKIKRNEEELEIKVTRAEVVTHTVHAKMLADNIGYIRISGFDYSTGDDFNVEIEKILADGAKSVILDLRNNPGGTLEAVVSVADTLLPEGKIITVKGKSGDEVVYRSDEDEIDVPICVLINENSASASEVLAGALRDHEKATLIGTTTYGKGVVQTILPLSDGSALKITTEEYFTPSGESIHEKGIDPDYEVAFESQKSVFALSEDEDLVLQKAIEFLSK